MFSQLYVIALRLSSPLPEEGYLGKLPVLRHLAALGELPITRPVTFLVGENGVGKSTLLEAVAVALGFNAEGGSVNFRFSTRSSHSELYKHLTVVRGVRRQRDGFFLRAESFFNVASNIEALDSAPGLGAPVLDSYGGVSLHEQSRGESFMALVANRFGGQGLYLLDEPEAALSPQRQMELLCHMDALVKRDSQFLISTHSPILMAFPGAEILQLDETGIRCVPYRETEHYRLTKRFLDAPERMLKYLLEEN